jgi:hypothetical protein
MATLRLATCLRSLPICSKRKACGSRSDPRARPYARSGGYSPSVGRCVGLMFEDGETPGITFAYFQNERDGFPPLQETKPQGWATQNVRTDEGWPTCQKPRPCPQERTRTGHPQTHSVNSALTYGSGIMPSWCAVKRKRKAGPPALCFSCLRSQSRPPRIPIAPVVVYSPRWRTI